jgi:hypothetical protein
MPKLSEHHSNKIVKLLYIGDSGTGKTGSLTSLVKAGYKIKIWDTDNGADILSQFVRHDCPDKLDNIEYEPLRDQLKATPTGPVVSGTPKAFVRAIQLLDKWTDGSVPSEGGDETIAVVDSFSGLGTAAMFWAQGMNAGAKDPRQWYFAAQQALEKVIDMLTSAAFKCNVIVISHIDYKEREDGVTKGYARAIGSALGPILPKYFNNLILCESSGLGKNVKRTIKTMPTGIIDLKTSAPFKFGEPLPIESGMAEIFAKLKE